MEEHTAALPLLAVCPSGGRKCSRPRSTPIQHRDIVVRDFVVLAAHVGHATDTDSGDSTVDALLAEDGSTKLPV